METRPKQVQTLAIRRVGGCGGGGDFRRFGGFFNPADDAARQFYLGIRPGWTDTYLPPRVKTGSRAPSLLMRHTYWSSRYDAHFANRHLGRCESLPGRRRVLDDGFKGVGEVVS